MVYVSDDCCRICGPGRPSYESHPSAFTVDRRGGKVFPFDKNADEVGILRRSVFQPLGLLIISSVGDHGELIGREWRRALVRSSINGHKPHSLGETESGDLIEDG